MSGKKNKIWREKVGVIWWVEDKAFGQKTAYLPTCPSSFWRKDPPSWIIVSFIDHLQCTRHFLHTFSLHFKETLQNCRKGNGYSKKMSNFYRVTLLQGVEAGSKCSSVWYQSLCSFQETTLILLFWRSLLIHVRSYRPPEEPGAPSKDVPKTKSRHFSKSLEVDWPEAVGLELLELCLRSLPRTGFLCGAPSRGCALAGPSPSKGWHPKL